MHAEAMQSAGTCCCKDAPEDAVTVAGMHAEAMQSAGTCCCMLLKTLSQLQACK